MTRRQLIEDDAKQTIFGRRIQPPEIQGERCQGCGTCEQVCPSQVFTRRGGRATVTYGEACIACGHCWAVCPEEAVTQQDVVTSARCAAPGAVVQPAALRSLLRQRRSVRLFTPEQLSKDKLSAVIDAGRYAPTGSNRQNVSYIVFREPEQVEQLRCRVEGFLGDLFNKLDNRVIAWGFSKKYGVDSLNELRAYAALYRFMDRRRDRAAYFPLPYGPAVILTHAQSGDASAPFNCAVALYSCALMAHSMSLGSCFLGFLQVAINLSRSLKKWIGLPAGDQCNGAMVVGRPAVKYRRLVERQEPEVCWFE
jgi:nitroreductase/NAD-dependent dihydropyrimidine dehydrogenase PreA subunit